MIRARLLIAGITLVSCADLRDFEATGICGNFVVEPASNEDCDTFGIDEGTACGLPGSNAPCRFICSVDPAEPDGARCPAGWSCGVDGVCSISTGQLARVGSFPQQLEVPEQILLADLDGDARLDLVSQGPAEISVRYGDAASPFSSVSTLPVGYGFKIAAGDVDEDGVDDLVVPQQTGVLVVPGTDDRTLTPVAYPNIQATSSELLNGSTIRFRAVRVVREGEENRPSDLLATLIRSPVEGEEDVFQTLVSINDGFLPIGIDTPPARDLPVGDVDRAPGQELVVSFPGHPILYVVGFRCTRAGCAPPFIVSTATATDPVKNGARLIDLNDDDNLDLFISVDTPNGPRVAVAFGNGQGRFADAAGRPDQASTSSEWPGLHGLLQCASRGRSGPCEQRDPWPHAIADLNEDGRLDFVGPEGVAYTRSYRPLEVVRQDRSMDPPRLTDAVVADFNEDGHLDIASVRAQVSGVDIQMGTGFELFNSFRASGQALVKLLEIGDFNGDRRTDLAFVEGAGEVYTLYTGGTGVPEDKVFVADLGTVASMEVLVDQLDGDLTSDLIVVADEAGIVSSTLLQGSGTGRMLAPLGVFDPNEGPLEGVEPHLTQLGRFGAGDDLVDLASIGRFPPDSVGEERLGMLRWQGRTGSGFDNGLELPGLPPDCLVAPRCALSAAHDIDGDGLDELIAVENSPLCATLGVLDATDSGVHILSVDPPSCDVLAPADGLTRPERLVVQDVDIDGHEDLVVVYAGRRAAAGGVEGNGIAIHWGGNGGFANEPRAFSAEISDAVRSVAIANFDATPEQELIVLGEGGNFTKLSIRDDRSVSEPSPILIRASDFVPGDMLGRGSLRVTDVDGDGLQDLIVSRQSAVEVLRQVPCAPGTVNLEEGHCNVQ